ncbi:MAG: hypothetical protein IK078_12640 [Lachnospiraceae bacterium]|nr:hypothetical protein [Lachnospiraceae bacterium]
MNGIYVLEILSDMVRKMAETDRPGINLLIAVVVSAAFLILVFNFFLWINPFWKKEKRRVRIEAVTRQDGGSYEIDSYYFAKVQVDGQTRHVICDPKCSAGQEINVFFSPDMIVKSEGFHFTIGRLWIIVFIIFGFKSLIDAWMNQTLFYLLFMLLLWGVYPVIYKLYYNWIMNRFSETIELEESGALESDGKAEFDIYNTDLMEHAPEQAKKALNGFLVVLLVAILALVGVAIFLMIKMLYF